MDPITHASLGAVIGGLTLGSRLGRKAVVLGAGVALLPDLDAFIAYGDAVSEFIHHRGFTHSWLVQLLVATGVAGLLAKVPATREIGFGRWWLFFFLIWATHSLNDLLTTYGTQVLWPLPVGPLSTGSIFVIDPFYTLPLLVAAIGALFYRFAPRLLVAGLVLSTVYAGSGLALKAWIDHRIQPVLAAMELEEQPRMVQPTPFNLLLWRVTVINGDEFLDAWVGIFDDPIRPDFERFERGDPELREAALALDDGQRLQWFSGDFLRFHRAARDAGPDRLVVTDIRLGVPGFFPFGFEIAEERNGDWEPITSRQVGELPRRDSLDALGGMLQRIVDPEGAPCIMDLGDPAYAITEPPPRCRMGGRTSPPAGGAHDMP
ncbi:metal-dependent hydrolase [Thioalkalivibrio sp. ALJ2]|uniref:metal-dependent hydrolase n=1 Tax=Thioalkalivibrio sp. ALJ2 TaxID=1261622 RepID=UPI000360F2A4|nr:metal-dependent hydrolase [Thioalkalivibrio sp. ALJ2]